MTTDSPASTVRGDSYRQLTLGLVFGVAFGFLLQKGGVAKFEVLIGVLLLRDYTVIQVMLSAIVTGMAGILIMHKLGWVALHIKPTQIGANIVGGLIFGVGFALSAYCPGTAAAALGQGNFDAVAVMAGMVAGSYFYALNSDWLNNTVGRWGDLGKATLPEITGIAPGVFAVGFWFLLVAALVALAYVPTLGSIRF